MVRSSTTVGRGQSPSLHGGEGRRRPCFSSSSLLGQGPGQLALRVRQALAVCSKSRCRGSPSSKFCDSVLGGTAAPPAALAFPPKKGRSCCSSYGPPREAVGVPGPWSVPGSRASLRSGHEEVRGRLLSEPCKNGAPTPKTLSARPEKPATGDAVRSTRSNREQPRRFPLAWSATATSHGSATVRRGPARRRTP